MTCYAEKLNIIAKNPSRDYKSLYDVLSRSWGL